MTVGHANPEIDGPELRELRKMAGLSITGLAAQVGCSFQYISQLERGDRLACSPALYARICESLRIDDRTVLLRRPAGSKR